MDGPTFDALVAKQLGHCTDVLNYKANEYAADGDRLHNFRVAAGLIGVPTRTALAGMMAKHTISIYDMCSTEETYTDELWLEKITDSINYLLLLKAVVEDDKPKSDQLVLAIDHTIQKSRREWVSPAKQEVQDIIAKYNDGGKEATTIKDENSNG